MANNTIEIGIEQAIACLFGLEAQVEALTNARSIETNELMAATLDRNIEAYKAIADDMRGKVWHV
jgi:hypothetical protein